MAEMDLKMTEESSLSKVSHKCHQLPTPTHKHTLETHRHPPLACPLEIVSTEKFGPIQYVN